MSKTTLVWSTQATSITDASLGAGYRLIMTITDSYLIDPNVFVFQRAPVTPGSTDFEDAFYSVASVADIANLAVANPSGDSVFYRSNALDLFFASMDELNDARIDIQDAMACLARANDLANALTAPEIDFYPDGSYDRYWGVSGDTTVTDAELLAFAHEPGTSRPTSKSIDTSGDTVYLYLAYRSELGAGTFTLNSITEAMTLITRAVVNTNGYSASYNIYRTTVTHNGSDLVLAVS